jgi:hypothetical protein
LISLVIGPVILVLFFEVQFLPYHNATVTWWHRIAVLFDLSLIWLFWLTIALRELKSASMARTRFRIGNEIQRVGTIGIMFLLTLGSPLLLLVATFEGEEL